MNTSRIPFELAVVKKKKKKQASYANDPRKNDLMLASDVTGTKILSFWVLRILVFYTIHNRNSYVFKGGLCEVLG